jgi:hypothetical protein
MAWHKCSYCGVDTTFPCETAGDAKSCGNNPYAPPDKVNPTHYSRWKMQPIEFIAVNDLPFWVANVIKYTMRFDAKDGLQDLYKAREYLNIKIRQLEGKERFWENG